MLVEEDPQETSLLTNLPQSEERMLAEENPPPRVNNSQTNDEAGDVEGVFNLEIRVFLLHMFHSASGQSPFFQSKC